MTFVGRVLVVVQVVLSVCFMAFAAAVYTVQNSWKEKHDGIVTKLEQTETDLNAQVEQVKKENEALQKSANDLQTKADTLQNSLAAVTQERDTLTAELKVEKEGNIKEQALSQRAETEAEIRRKEADDQRVRNESLLISRGDLVKRVQQLEDEKFNTQEEVKKLIAKYNAVLQEASTYKTVIVANGLSTDPRDYLDKPVPPPAVQGLVLQTRRGKRSGTELIEISLGSDDGLLEGHDLHVYRSGEGGKYLGRIRIVHVAHDSAVGTLVKRARNGSIQRGDNVTTKL